MEIFGKRLDSIRDALTPSTSARQRMAQENVELSRLAYYRALVSVADETLFKLVSILYEGGFCKNPRKGIFQHLE
jgi:hypothetical protein